MEWNYLFIPNSIGAAVKVWDWISNFIQHCTLHVITYPCWDSSYTLSVKGTPRYFRLVEEIVPTLTSMGFFSGSKIILTLQAIIGLLAISMLWFMPLAVCAVIPRTIWHRQINNAILLSLASVLPYELTVSSYNISAVVAIQSPCISLSNVCYYEQFTKPSRLYKFPTRGNRCPADHTNAEFLQRIFPYAFYSFFNHVSFFRCHLSLLLGLLLLNCVNLNPSLDK